MSVNQEFEKTGSIAYLCDEYLKNNFIDPEASERLGVKPVSYTHLAASPSSTISGNAAAISSATSCLVTVMVCS